MQIRDRVVVEHTVKFFTSGGLIGTMRGITHSGHVLVELDAPHPPAVHGIEVKADHLVLLPGHLVLSYTSESDTAERSRRVDEVLEMAGVEQ